MPMAMQYQNRVDRDKPRNLKMILDLGPVLWTEDDSGLPTVPLTITTLTIKTFL